MTKNNNIEKPEMIFAFSLNDMVPSSESEMPLAHVMLDKRKGKIITVSKILTSRSDLAQLQREDPKLKLVTAGNSDQVFSLGYINHEKQFYRNNRPAEKKVEDKIEGVLKKLKAVPAARSEDSSPTNPYRGLFLSKSPNPYSNEFDRLMGNISLSRKSSSETLIVKMPDSPATPTVRPDSQKVS